MGQLTFQATLGGSVNLAGPNTASTTTFTLPAADGTNGQALTTNGSGTLSFASIAASQWTTTGSNIYYSTGNVGIGTSSPVSTFQVAGSYTNTSDATIVASANIPGINLRTASAGRFSILLGYSNNNVTSFMTGTGTNNPSTEVMVIDHSTTNIRFQNCISVGAATPASTGAGITFPATQSASSDANTLDDYEEGSFTFTGTGFTTSPTKTAYYTKIGNQVTVTLPDITGTSNSTLCTITGLPVALRANAAYVSFLLVYNASVTYTGHIYGGHDTAVQIFWDATESAFTASGVKGITNIANFTYTIY